jgi:hypothetical protein
MELLDRHLLGVERAQHVVDVARQLDQPGHPVCRPLARRTRSVPADEPLDLERHLQFQPEPGRPPGHGAREAALAGRVGLVLLGPPVDRCPGPTRLGGEHRQLFEVRIQP